MRRIGLAALTALFATSGLAVAGHGGLLDTQPDEKTRAARAAVGFQTEKQITVGNSGETASLVQDEVTLTPESNVNAQGPEQELGEPKRTTVSQ